MTEKRIIQCRKAGGYRTLCDKARGYRNHGGFLYARHLSSVHMGCSSSDDPTGHRVFLQQRLEVNDNTKNIFWRVTHPECTAHNSQANDPYVCNAVKGDLSARVTSRLQDGSVRHRKQNIKKVNPESRLPDQNTSRVICPASTNCRSWNM